MHIVLDKLTWMFLLLALRGLVSAKLKKIRLFYKLQAALALPLNHNGAYLKPSYSFKTTLLKSINKFDRVWENISYGMFWENRV